MLNRRRVFSAAGARGGTLRLALVAALLAAPARGARLAELLPPHARGGAQFAELVAADAAADAALAARLGLGAGWRANSSSQFKPTLVDHFAAPASPRVFSQRFFYDMTFCGGSIANCTLPGVPIVCEMTGEWTAGGAPGGAAAELAASLGALTVTVEHRAYGCSQLAGGCRAPADASDNVAFLNVEQALEDSADFVVYFEAFVAAGFSAPDVAPTWAPGFAPARKWAIVGGSYAGAFVTWFTVRHGDLVAATWSSSGVTKAIFNFSAFDETVSAAVGPDCTAALQAVTAAFESAWDTDNARFLALFNATYAGLTKQDAAWMLSDSAGMAPQYGAKAALCRFLNSTSRATPASPAPAGGGGFPTGWAALEAFAAWTSFRYGPGFGSSCYYSTACLSSQANASAWSDTTTWVLQCCNELAFWNIASPAESSRTRSRVLTSDYFVAQCRAVYGASVFPDTDAFNARFGGATPLVGAHPVVALQGSDDPWQGAGVQAPISATYLEYTATCSGCSHCRDLSGSLPTDPPELTAARQAALTAMRGWMAGAPAAAAAAAPPAPVAAIAGGAAGGIVLVAVGAFLVASGRAGRLLASCGLGGGNGRPDSHALLAGA
jgi:hypothetical protein